jgi:hypothetical protein
VKVDIINLPVGLLCSYEIRRCHSRIHLIII